MECVEGQGEDGARGKDWLRAWGASPVSYRHKFLFSLFSFFLLMVFIFLAHLRLLFFFRTSWLKYLKFDM